MKKTLLTTLILLSSCVEAKHRPEVYAEVERVKEEIQLYKETQAEIRQQAFYGALANFEGESFNEPNTKLFFWNNYGYYSKIDSEGRGMRTYEFLNYLDAERPPKAVREYVRFWLQIENPTLRNSVADIIWQDYLSRIQ